LARRQSNGNSTPVRWEKPGKTPAIPVTEISRQPDAKVPAKRRDCNGDLHYAKTPVMRRGIDGYSPGSA